jgi:benzoylformate decarboxylase
MNTIRGSSAFLSLLKDEGVTHLFGNPGTTELPIMDALGRDPELRYVLGLQESIVVAMADGFGRASGRLTACNVHVAPGLGNAMGSIYNARFTGTPIIITAGQQEQGHGLMEPLLYDSLVPIATPLVKWATEITRLADMPRIVRRAAKVAMTPPTGPVFLSLPGDVLNDEAGVDLAARTRVDAASRPSDAAVDRLAARLLAAKRPAIIAGDEIVRSDALADVARFAEVLGAAAYQQTISYGAHFPSEHPAYMGALSRNQKDVRRELEGYDLLVFVGADVLRMSVYSEIDPLPPGVGVIQIGLLDWEMGKNYPAEIAIRSDVGETLRAVIPVLRTKGGQGHAAAAAARLAALEGSNWTARQRKVREQALARAAKTPISPEWLMAQVVDALPADAVVVNEGLTSAARLLDLLPYRDRYGYHGNASGGIGWAIAAAIGIQLAQPERPVVALVGDGSAMYSIQALWTAAHLGLPITYVITNNKGYRILKQRLLAFHGNDKFIGMDLDSPEIDFVGLARSFGLAAQRIVEPGAVRPALDAAIASRRPTLLDVAVDGPVRG